MTMARFFIQRAFIAVKEKGERNFSWLSTLRTREKQKVGENRYTQGGERRAHSGELTHQELQEV